MKKDDTTYLHHILDSIQRIEDYIRGVSVEQFLKSGVLQDAVVRRLGIIGEASGNFSDEFRKQHSGVPWSQIIGLRNRVNHAYFDVDLDIVWDIARNDLPDLKRQMEKILEDIEGNHTK